MDRNSRNDNAPQSAGGSLPTAAWLFAQAVKGKPIPDAATANSRGRPDREQLEWLASISDRHEGEWRRLQSAEPEARREREQLEWLAQISEEHERKLRAQLRE